MGTDTPLIFRPSVAQRALAALLSVGCWLVGVRAISILFQALPAWFGMLQRAREQGDPTWGIWTVLVLGVLACGVAGISLLLSILAFVLIEGCQVVVDELGIAVECHTLPFRMARWFGAGRLGWRQVLSLEKRGWAFVVRGNPLLKDETPQTIPEPTVALRFLMVEHLERLLLLILERSPNLR